MKISKKQEIGSYCPPGRQEWRHWLQENHQKLDAVWLICHKKQSGMPVLRWEDAVEEALCFGWIDSVRKPIDDDKFMQFFSKRKPKSTWSKINKEKVVMLMEHGQMTAAGIKSVEIARQNGSWNVLDTAEELQVPADLQQALDANQAASEFYTKLSKSGKRVILLWLVLAKRPETRQKRILDIIQNAQQGLKPAHLR